MAKKPSNDVDVSYRRWASGLDRSVLEKAIEEAAIAQQEKPMPRSYRPYAPRKPSRAALEEADQASFAIDEAGDELGIDERLERLSSRIVRRMELDLQYFSVPQLLTGLQRCLQVRVLLLTIQKQGGGSNVGSAVKHYYSAFAEKADDVGDRAGNRGRTKPEPDNAYDNILELISADEPDEPEDAPARSPRTTGKGRVAGRNRS
jgi:hypothetical protein